MRDSNRPGPGAGSDRWTGDRRKVEDRRAGQERRAGGERRVREESRAGAERRSGRERRAGERRTPRERRSEADWVTVPLEFDANTALGSAQELLVAAIDARTRAHARYSGFKVGAALATPEGRVFTGCNIENATYGLTLCAERVALVKALSDAASVFTRIVVVADTEAPTPPCGSCRQLLWEYCGDIEVVLANLSGPISRHRLAALLPLPFDGRLLE